MIKTQLRQRVILTNDLAWWAERDVTLPIPPFVGLRLYNTEVRPPDCDENEEVIEEIEYDLKSGLLVCYLPTNDYRPERSGSEDWTEEMVRLHYSEWKLTR